MPEGGLEHRLEHLYAHRFSPEERRRKAQLWQTLCRHAFQRFIPADATVIDLGAGYCDFINAIHAARKIAVDLNPETARSADSGVQVIPCALDHLAQHVDPESVDCAFASNVFEHLRDPETLLDVLNAVHGILRPGGRILIMQPNVRVLGGAFWDFLDHRLPLSERGMAEALALSGFRLERVTPRFLPYTTKSRLPAWPWLVRVYLAVPPAQWLFGKQMLVIARKS
jgi:SAM-dependent methyltransferase